MSLKILTSKNNLKKKSRFIDNSLIISESKFGNIVISIQNYKNVYLRLRDMKPWRRCHIGHCDFGSCEHILSLPTSHPNCYVMWFGLHSVLISS